MMNRAFITRTTALAALLALPLAPVAAQQNTTTQDQSAQDQSAQDSGQSNSSDSASSDTTTDSGNDGSEADSVVVTVGDAQIFGSDVMRAIGMLPPAMRQQPSELLLPAAVQQLVIRELILERARSENLSEDPTFTEMAEQASAEARDSVTVQYWLQREMADAVSDEAVNTAYDQITQNAQGDVPPLDAVRPQIEQELRRREMARIQADLQTNGPEITFAGQAQEASYSDGTFCTASYSPGESDATEQAGSEFAVMDLDGDGMVSQQEYRKCRTAASSE